MRHEFLLAFVDALQPVFLVGAGFTAVAFVLALTLREVPLRKTTAATAEAAEAAGGAGRSGGGTVGAWPRLRTTSPDSRSRAGARSSASTT